MSTARTTTLSLAALTSSLLLAFSATTGSAQDGSGQMFADAASCEPIPASASPANDTLLDVRFINQTRGMLTVTWIDYDGREQDLTTIPPGEAIPYQTFQSHLWVFKDDDGQCVAALLTQEGIGDYIIAESNPGGVAPAETAIDEIFTDPPPEIVADDPVAAPAPEPVIDQIFTDPPQEGAIDPIFADTGPPPPPGVVFTSESILVDTVAYPSMCLLAYPIQDAGPSGHFVADVEGSGAVREGRENATLFQMYVAGPGQVFFATGLDSPEGARFLSANEDGAFFSPTPGDDAYFLVRPPLEGEAAQQGYVSLESQMFPGQYLRHAGLQLMLDPVDADAGSPFPRDASFLALTDCAGTPDSGRSVDILTTMVTEFGTDRQITIETAVYEILETNFLTMNPGDSVELSFVVTLLTSLYDVSVDVATEVVLTIFDSKYVTSINDFVSVEMIVTTVKTRRSVTGGFYLATHFESLTLVDMGACGTEEGGFGGFGKGRVPTNSHGDVHIFTPDGLAYDFQDGGEFTLAASADGLVEVQTRQTIHEDDPSVSSNTAVAIRFGTEVLEFYSDKDGQRTYFAGQLIDLPDGNSASGPELLLGNGGVVLFDGDGKSGPRYLVTSPDGSFVARVNMYAQFLNVGVSASQGTYSGLIGNLDGNPRNDMLARNGTDLICPPADGPQLARFGDSWRVTVEETLLRAELDESLVAVATEIGTGRRVSVEVAAIEALEASMTSMEATGSVEVSVIVSLLTTTYQVSEDVATAVVIRLFEERGVTSVTDVIDVTTVTEVVEVYRERREVRTIETLDIKVRAKAQRICEASGVTDQLALANCVLDTAATQNEAFVDSSISFQEVIIELPTERRHVGTSVSNPLAPEALLPPEQVIEIIGPADVVPTFEELTTLVQQIRTEEVLVTETVEERVVTQVTSDITSTVDLGACSEVGGLQTPTELLEANPAAGGVAIYCATHVRGGQTVTVELGRTLEEAIGKAEASCQDEAASRVDDFGDVVIDCREIGRAEREFDFDGGVLAVGRDVKITLSERRIEKTELLTRIQNFSLVLGPVPGLTAECMAGESVPIRGLTVTDGLLDYTGEGESDFQNLCGQISMEETGDDYLLQATCFNDDATDAAPSAISLLGIAAVEELIAHPNCAPETVEDGPFKLIAEDGLEAMFPTRGDFVLIRSVGADEPGIVVNVRRDLWVADKSKSVFTALTMRVGTDLVEVRATPEPGIFVNGEPLEVAVGEPMSLPGGGNMRIEEDGIGPAAHVVTWPDGVTFAVRFVLHPGSHVSPAIQAGDDYDYEGLVRFTMDWTLTGEDGGFAYPLETDPTCNCSMDASEGP